MRQQRIGSVASIGLATSIMAGLAGCQTGSSSSQDVVTIEGSRGQVFDQWGSRLREMGMTSVVPPKEDIRVGDIMAMGYNPQEVLKGGQGASVRLFSISSKWGSLDVDDNLRRQYGARSSWPEGQGSEESRPHIVSLTSLSSVDYTGHGLGALVPTEMAPLITGWAGSAEMGITMRVASAESYSLDVPAMLGLIMEESSADTQRRYFVRQPYRDGLRFIADSGNRVWLQVINEVLYARTVDIAVRITGERAPADEVTAAELAMVASAAQPQPSPQPSAQEGQAEAAAAPTEAATPAQAAPSGAGALAVSKLDPIYGAYLRADAINDIFRESDAYEYPGGFTRFVSVTDESMSLRRTWDPGLAIGVRGITLEVDAETGEVLRAGPMGLALRQLNEPVLASDQPAAP